MRILKVRSNMSYNKRVPNLTSHRHLRLKLLVPVGAGGLRKWGHPIRGPGSVPSISWCHRLGDKQEEKPGANQPDLD